MASYKAAAFAKDVPELVNDNTLHASDIRHERVCSQDGSQLERKRGHRADRYAEHNQIGRVANAQQVVGSFVSDRKRI
jgi:hypothetical protein